MSSLLEQFDSVVNTAISKKAESIANEYARTLVACIKYEFSMANMELANSWRKHGYDFQMMPENFIEQIRVSPVIGAGDSFSITGTAPQESFAGEKQSKIDFFNQYVIENAKLRLKTLI